MALHSKKDFASLCGFSTRDLAVYIKRNKVIMSGDYVDDSHSVNKEFLEKRRGKVEPAPPEKKLRLLKPDPGVLDVPNTGDETDEGDGDDGDVESGYQLNKKKLKKQIAKLEVDTRLQELKEEKLRGELIPVELVKNLFRSYTQSIVTANKDGIEELLINFSLEHRLKGDQLSTLRGKVVGILNSSVDKSVTVAQKNLQSLINQVKVKRDVGERK
jgi:hypothetical protein